MCGNCRKLNKKLCFFFFERNKFLLSGRTFISWSAVVYDARKAGLLGFVTAQAVLWGFVLMPASLSY